MSVDAPRRGQVSVIIGGGSGHYPAFAGLVGPGCATGRSWVRCSPALRPTQAYRAIRALDGGAGVLLSFGNYSGDVMHFGLAAEQARAAGIDVRIVLVTDDVVCAPATGAQTGGASRAPSSCSAPPAAAPDGARPRRVERIARQANARTRTFGVASPAARSRVAPSPCSGSSPARSRSGSASTASRASDGRLDARRRARGGARSRRSSERPAGARGPRLVNGLGSTKYEELFVLYRSLPPIAARLAGVEVVDPEVGEFVTSLDMAGCSLTLCWLDDELEPLLATPAADPGLSHGRWTLEPDPSPRADPEAPRRHPERRHPSKRRAVVGGPRRRRGGRRRRRGRAGSARCRRRRR